MTDIAKLKRAIEGSWELDFPVPQELFTKHFPEAEFKGMDVILNGEIIGEANVLDYPDPR